MSKKTKLSVFSKWGKLLEMIPGYSPIETAGDCWFDEERAQLSIDFFHEHLVFIEGEKAGQPFILELWQQSILANIFGWIRPDGTRRYREAFLFEPRKNGKTPFAAGIVDFVAFADGEPGAQIYSSAGEKEQAALIYRHAAGMIARNPELAKRARCYRTFKSIEFYEGDCIYRALTADADTKHGQNTHLVINDELHIHKNRDLIDTLETSTASRREPLIIHITTAGFDKHSICYEKYSYAKKVRDGDIDDPKFFPVIYEALEDDDWTDEKVWYKANPNLGVSVSLDYFKGACQKAQDIPASENTFKRLHLNIWTEQETRWLSMIKWNACDEKCDEANLIGRECFAGLDLSSNKDITAFVMAFKVDNNIVLIPRFWIPKANAHERERKDGVPYSLWERQGFLTMTEGNVIDYEYVIDDIQKDFEKFDVRGVAFDRFGFEAVRQRFIRVGADESKFISFGQGYLSMSPPMKELEKLVLEGVIVHNDNPVLKWMASNVAVLQDPAGNVKTNKDKSSEKIDGIVASIMAIGLMTVDPGATVSVYETRGIRSVG
jgi:phage terminase large subunit-like protein